MHANYYSILMDGSTGSSVIEQELIYVLFLNNGTPQVKFFSIESVKSADAEGLLLSLKGSFNRIGILNWTSNWKSTPWLKYRRCWCEYWNTQWSWYKNLQ